MPVVFFLFRPEEAEERLIVVEVVVIIEVIVEIVIFNILGRGLSFCRPLLYALSARIFMSLFSRLVLNGTLCLTAARRRLLRVCGVVVLAVDIPRAILVLSVYHLLLALLIAGAELRSVSLYHREILLYEL